MNPTKSFVREKRIYCGEEYFEVDLFEMTDFSQRGRKEKKGKSKLKQIKANEKNSRRYFIQLVNTNFTDKDFCVHCTYNRESMPETVEEAEKNIKNYIRRLQSRRKKEGLPAMKYIIVTEYRQKEDGTPTRIHHHIIMDGLLSRDIVDDLWRRKKSKGEKKGQKLGLINVDKLQPDEFGLQALALYLTKGLTGRKKWHPSINLKKPVVKKNDYKYSRRKLMELSQLTDCNSVWQKLYPGYLLTEATGIYTDERGWIIHVKMRRDKGAAFYHSGNSSGIKRIRES